MTSSALELLDLVARWIHVIAGIMWVGNSLLFNWLDRNLRRVPPPSTAVGDIWLLHSGGFYYVEKTLLSGGKIPTPLHWFKWQAYTTWLSGMALLVVVYYLGGRAALTDGGAGSLGQGAAVAVSLGAVFGGVAFYNLIQKFVAPRAPTAATVVWLAALIAISIELTHVFSGRAAYLHVGAMLGTIMAGNVFLTIVPSQHDLVRSVTEGGAGDPEISARAKRVSIHNNYFTFPVIALMISGHFPALYGNRWNWALLIVLCGGGAAVRHILNVRFTFDAWPPALGIVMVGTVIALSAIMRLPAPSTSSSPSTSAVETPTFADVRHVIDRRCAVCHSAQPADLTFGAAPAGVMFDTPEQIVARAARINERAVVTRTMPPGNKTNVTDAERALLSRWIAAGAPGR